MSPLCWDQSIILREEMVLKFQKWSATHSRPKEDGERAQEETSSCTECLDLSLVCYKTLKEQADTWAMALFLLILKGNLHTFLLWRKETDQIDN